MADFFSLVKTVEPIIDALVDVGGTPYIVGGSVRDAILGIPSKDIDVEVFGLDAADVEAALISVTPKVDAVGRSFGVFKVKLGDLDVDVSLPRRDSKVGVGHTGFIATPDPNMTVEEAASRRDFTINAISVYVDGSVIDPYGGVNDLRNGVLRAVSPAFAEDPLRVLRGVQFASRYNLRLADKKTADLCVAVRNEFKNLDPSRVWGEWEKWALRGVTPSTGLKFLQDSGWLVCYPELASMTYILQEFTWHPEVGLWNHTLHTVDAAARLSRKLSREERLVLMFAALCHDMGKITTTCVGKDKIIRSPGHPQAGVPLADKFLTSIGFPLSLKSQVFALIEEHLNHLNGSTPRAVRKLALRLGQAKTNVRMLTRLVWADHAGRPPLPTRLPKEAKDILRVARSLSVGDSAPKPLVMGRHLIALGIQPGPDMGEILKACFNAQIEGVFATTEEGLMWLKLQTFQAVVNKG